ncbi:MAG: NADH-quinone oxidoreductase subunit NuoF [Clostridiales bacterium]|jgi:NADH:ubiquinone oxidoreductase subunit F (NADH-binding)/(2Fe-2S) ferredoxin/NAD-dependent dihydropyrimidine dehydrogenase PreA subunit|nr:NADH-quinone oxidoreductase subunit NuoF [Clostridiales bacterium]
MHILVCGGTGCVSSDSKAVHGRFVAELAKHKMDKEVQVVTTGCFGFCEQGPIVKIYPDNIFYTKVAPADVELIVKEHVVKGRVVEKLLYHDPEKGTSEAEHRHIPFYKSQMRIALRNCGIIDPEKIDDYISVDGYAALGKALESMTPDLVVEEIKRSGLRGRGGAGFPTGLKWDAAKKAAGAKKYVVCNADEGDPGAFMDRSVLEGDPHSVLEAMAICGYAIGADEGVIYIRAEYPLAVERLRIAIAQAEEYGLLGGNILGSDFSFHIRINLGAGAFVCGEETALLNSIQGSRGEPRTRPPFPAQKGLWLAPTNNNNVETYANICPIILKGADWYSSIGTEKSKGTKVFALAGKINNVGLVEVPMGTTIREIVYGIGGGIRGDKKFKALQTGGPSGGCISNENLDLPVEYESLASVGSMMGSGGMIILDEDDCMVNIAKFYLEFTVDESCGKCTPCRIGNRRMHEILERITQGNGTMADLDELKDLGEIIKDCSLCGLGQTAPNPVLSTLRYFYDEYEAHVKEKKCPAGACKNLLKYRVLPEKCIGCTLCARNCPVSCIEGERKKAHVIDSEKCIKCGVCYSKCPVKAIVRD